MSYIESTSSEVSIRTRGLEEDSSARSRPNSWKTFQIATQGDRDDASWGGDGFGFDDFIDMVNPLQHIPIVGSIYRAATGDEIAPEARILGGGVFGGVAGAAVAAVNAIVEKEAGMDMGSAVMALMGTDQQSEPEVVAVSSVSRATPDIQVSARMQPAPAVADIQPAPLPFDVPPEATAVAPALPASASASDKEENKEEPVIHERNQTILELFGRDTASIHQGYQQAQMISHVMDVARDMKA